MSGGPAGSLTAVRICPTTTRSDGTRTDELVSSTVAQVCLDPAVWEMLAWQLAAPGREADIGAAIARCDEGYARKPPYTTEGAWLSLEEHP